MQVMRGRTFFWHQNVVFPGKMTICSVFVTEYSINLNESYKGSPRGRKIMPECRVRVSKILGQFSKIYGISVSFWKE
jgi:hypothetical protein